MVVPAATVAVAVVLLITLRPVAGVPLIVTLVAPVKLVPNKVTTVPTGPEVGVKLVMVGSEAVTTKELLLNAFPAGVVMRTKPVVLPLETTAVAVVEFTTTRPDAVVPLKATLVAPVKLIPVIVTLVPIGPDVGVKLVMTGAALEVEYSKKIVCVTELQS